MAKKKKSAKTAAPKIKLSREQQANVKQFLRPEYRIYVCHQYIRLWSNFFRFFADDISQHTITEQEEKGFSQSISQLAAKHFLFCELMSDSFESGDKIMEVLLSSGSLSNIKGMNEGTLSKLELDWHSTLLNMYVAMGRLARLLPPGMRVEEAIKKIDEEKRLAAEAAAEGRPAPRRGGGAGLMDKLRRRP